MELLQQLGRDRKERGYFGKPDLKRSLHFVALFFIVLLIAAFFMLFVAGVRALIVLW